MQGQPQVSQRFGGGGGSEHHFVQSMNLCLVGVKGRSGDSIDQIQFLFRDITTGQFMESRAYGGRGGRPWCYQAPPGQWIDKIWFQQTAFLKSVKFGTNLGVVSNEYGSNGHRSGYYDVSGRRITGVITRCGGLVDAVTFLSV